MSFDWQRVEIGQLAKLRSGFPFKSADWKDSGVPVIKIANVKGGRIIPDGCGFVSTEVASKSAEWFTRTGDVLIAMTGYVGEVAQVKPGERYLINQRVGRFDFTPNAEVEPTYFFYHLQHPDTRAEIEGVARGSAQPNLSAGDAHKIKITLPPLAVQREIAAILGTLDDRITLLRETNATLEAIAQALFKSWFVDFDPVRAKMEGRIPEGMDEATAELFPDSFEETEWGAMPRGWRLVPFGQLLGHTIGGDWGSEVPDEKNDTQVAIIRGTDIPDLQSSRDCRVPIRYTSQKKLSTRRLQDGDIVIEVSGGSKEQPTGRALYVTEDLLRRFDCPVEPASFCRLFRPVSRQVGVLLAQHLRYIYDQGKTWEYQNQSTGIANFQTTHFLEAELVAVPPELVLSRFSETVRTLVDRTVSNQIGELSQIRDTLLPRLISGNVCLPELCNQTS